MTTYALSGLNAGNTRDAIRERRPFGLSQGSMRGRQGQPERIGRNYHRPDVLRFNEDQPNITYNIESGAMVVAWYSDTTGWVTPALVGADTTERRHNQFVREALRAGGIPFTDLDTRRRTTASNEGATTMATKTMGAIRAEVTANNVEQIESWEDPRLYTLLTKLHTDAEGKNYCSTFDEISLTLGIPARPKKDYFKITRSGTVPFGGVDYAVEASVEVYGEVGDEAGAIATYHAKYGEEFDVVLGRALKKNAMSAIMDGLVVVTEGNIVPVADKKDEKSK